MIFFFVGSAAGQCQAIFDKFIDVCKDLDIPIYSLGKMWGSATGNKMYWVRNLYHRNAGKKFRKSDKLSVTKLIWKLFSP